MSPDGPRPQGEGMDGVGEMWLQDGRVRGGVG